MPVCSINGKNPVIGEGTWIAPNAYVVGNVRIGRGCYVGFGACIRGDFGAIIIGDETAVEESVVIHCLDRVEIGSRVILGHMAMIHNTTIRDCALIGMQAMIADFSTVGEWAIIAEKSMVMKKQVVPPGKIYRGIPAAETGEVRQKHIDYLTQGQERYAEIARQYAATFILL